MDEIGAAGASAAAADTPPRPPVRVPVEVDTPRGTARAAQRLRRTRRRRRRLRVGLIQVIYIAAALALASVMPLLDADPEVDPDGVTAMMFTLAAGLIAAIALVFGLLFLVVPYANTSLSPRLTLFRNNPLVWHAFSMFIGTIVFLTVTGLALGPDDHVSFLVPATVLLLLLVVVALIRSLQFRAFRSLQLGVTLVALCAHGEEAIGSVYPEPLADEPPWPELPPAEEVVRWPHGLTTLSMVDVTRAVRLAHQHGAVIEVLVQVGSELRRGTEVIAVHGAVGTIDRSDLLRVLETSPDRTFDQDPLFAFRLLVDIALRALSTALNDPVTAVQAIGGVHSLLVDVAGRELDMGRFGDHDGALRVVLPVPSWEDFLAAGVDELAPYAAGSPMAKRRLAEMVESLLAEVPPSRRGALETRVPIVA